MTVSDKNMILWNMKPLSIIDGYRGADNSLTRPTSRCIFLMVRIFRLMLVLFYIYIYIHIYIYIYILLIFLQL
jgi:hypothetical protein